VEFDLKTIKEIAEILRSAGLLSFGLLFLVQMVVIFWLMRMNDRFAKELFHTLSDLTRLTSLLERIISNGKGRA